MKVFNEFLDEVINLDPRLTIVANPNYPQLANIKLDGINICAIPSGEIKDEPDPGYTVTFSNGFISKHRCRREAIDLIKNTLENIKTPEGREIFYARE